MKCNLCESYLEFLFNVKQSVFNNNVEYKIMRCKNCLHSVTTLNDSFNLDCNDFYNGTYNENIHTYIKNEKKWRFEKNLALVQSKVQENVLDV